MKKLILFGILSSVFLIILVSASIQTDGTLTKLVDGKRISLSHEEELSVREEWAENERLKEIEDAKPVPLTMEEQIDVMHQTMILLQDRIFKLEQMLNITYVEPKEDSLPLYSCAIGNSVKECPYGLSGGKHTRCYLSEILTVKT